MAPFVVMFVIFWVYPIGYSFYLSLTSWDGFGPKEFIGIDNYVRLISDSSFLTALRNTLLAAVVYVAILLVLATGIAILLGWMDIRLRSVFRTALFLPVATALVVSAVVFSFIYGRDFGALNELLAVVGIPKQDWLGDPNLALWSIVAMRIWRNTGYYAVFLIAALQTISPALYEAARIDGASVRQMITRITLPLLRPMMVYVAVVSTIWALQLFDEPWVLTGGGPAEATTTMVIYLYQNTFQYFSIGYGAAISYVLTAIILVFAVIQMKLLSPKDEQ